MFMAGGVKGLSNSIREEIIRVELTHIIRKYMTVRKCGSSRFEVKRFPENRIFSCFTSEFHRSK